MRTPYQLRVEESVSFLQRWAPAGFRPKVALVLGSGLSGIFDTVPTEASAGSQGGGQQAAGSVASTIRLLGHVGYNAIPGFKATAVKGHAGDLAILRIAGVDVVALRGRVHAYEGYDAGEVTHGLRTAINWGATRVVLTNAAGCLVHDWEIGRLVVLRDQINGTGLNPLVAPFGDGFGPRFVDMSEPFDPELNDGVCEILKTMGTPFYEGVYYGVLGSSYETPAEVRMFRQLGAHAVGMSTVLETIAARQMGARVIGFSFLSNFGSGIKPGPLHHDEVLAQGRSMVHVMASALPAVVQLCSGVGG